METPVEIVFRNVEASEALEARVHEKMERLNRIFDRITSAHVTIEAPAKQPQGKPKTFLVTIDLDLPHHAPLVVKHEPSSSEPHDAYAALRDAFAKAQRLLQEHADRLAGRVKTH
jgi:putative sigma-54 modulation protein